QIVTRARAFLVDTREQDLARAPRDAFARPVDGVEFRAHTSARRVHPPGISVTLRVDTRDDALRAETARTLGHDLRPLHCSRVDAHLVRARPQLVRHAVHRANATADRERYEQPLRRPAREIEHRPALLVRGADVEKDDLVGTVTLIALGELDGIADVTKPLEPDALHDTAPPYIEADDQSSRQTHVRFRRFLRSDTLPFVLRTLPVSASACPREKPRALNAASTTWWRSSPRSTRMCSVTFPASQNERIQCSKNVLGIGPL